MRSSVADRPNESGVPVIPNDPDINVIFARCAETPNGHSQRDALPLAIYIWCSQNDARSRAAHAEYDDQVYTGSTLPSGSLGGRERLT